jgi:hypothetical protein
MGQIIKTLMWDTINRVTIGCLNQGTFETDRAAVNNCLDETRVLDPRTNSWDATCQVNTLAPIH